jgi:DNA mismatch endonuclease, patch repair protein
LHVTADVVFRRARVAVFVDGCFWHVCPLHGTMPKSNRAWWADKLQANVERDRRTDVALAEHGWRVLRIWEHESSEQAADRVEQLLRDSPGDDTRLSTRRA